jgi:hypothetical protein
MSISANGLLPSSLRGLPIRIAPKGIVQAKWSKQILDEAFAHL